MPNLLCRKNLCTISTSYQFCDRFCTSAPVPDEAQATDTVMRFVHDDIDSDGNVPANFLEEVTC